MKKIFWIILAGFTFASCSGSEESGIDSEESNEIVYDLDSVKTATQNIEKEINSTPNPSDQLLKDGIHQFQEYAGLFPDEPDAPDYLLKASDFAYQVKQFEKSVKILDRIINDYPDYNRLEDVYFNKASHLDFELRDTTLAKEAYQEFINKFPESELIDDAESRIQYIGLSAEDLIKMFEENLQEQPQ